jgi:predicted ArsR family transcriptional regulator
MANVTDGTRTEEALNAPGLGASQRALLDALKRGGPAAIPALAAELELNVETIRHHMQVLSAAGLVERRGTRRVGRGRPEVIYGLASGAESLFPRREGEVLRALVEHLQATGQEAVLRTFFESYIDARRADLLARVEGLEGAARVEEAGRILTELGFMAEVDGDTSNLKLCHCPLREVVSVSRVPCRAELAFARELMGEPLTRLSHIPSGDASCTYRWGSG